MSSEVSAGSFKFKTMITSAGGTSQQSQIITEAPAKVWYNKLRMTHTYELKGVSQTKVVDFPIAHKTETLFSQCSFTAGLLGAGAGYSCDSIFSDNGDSTYVTLDKYDTVLSPAATIGSSSARPYYEGNSVFTKVDYSVSYQSDDSETFGLFYYGVCNEGVDGKEITLNPKYPSNDIGIGPLISKLNSENVSVQVVELFSELPTVGTGEGSVAELSENITGEYYIRVSSTDETKKPNFNINQVKIGSSDITSLDSIYYEDGKYFIYTITIPASSNKKFKFYSSSSVPSDDIKIDLISAEKYTKQDELASVGIQTELKFVDSTVSGILERTFMLNSNTGFDDEDDGKIYFSVINPISGQTIESSGDTLNIPLSYILQNNLNKN